MKNREKPLVRLRSPAPDEPGRTDGWVLPLCGILTCILFILLPPVWYPPAFGRVKPWVLLAVGVLPSIAAIPLHLRGSKGQHHLGLWYGVSTLLNGVGTSLCMTAYYVFLGSAPSTDHTMVGALPAVVLYLLTAILMKLWPRRYPLLTGILALLTVGLMIAAVVLWVQTPHKVFFSFAFFNLLWSLISVCALHVACTDEASPILRFVSFASFGILLGVAAIVLVILACAGGDCDCDCGDCCDCGEVRGKQKKGKQGFLTAREEKKILRGAAMLAAEEAMETGAKRNKKAKDGGEDDPEV